VIYINSTDDADLLLGGRVAYSTLWDALDAYFREGGSTAVVSRVVGPASVTATLVLHDNAAAPSLDVSGLGPGAYYDNIHVAVLAGLASGYRLQVTDQNSNILETSADLQSQTDAVAWGQFSNYISIALGTSTLPPAVAAPAPLAGGVDDRANITDAQWLSALNALGSDAGPGQVSCPGATSAIRHQQLLDHAAANNRVALLDLPDSGSAATLLSATATDGFSHYGAAFAPWMVCPGVVSGTTRTIPPSPFVAGRICKVDPEYGAGTPAAGAKGILVFPTALSQPGWDDVTRDQLNTGRVNVIRQFGNSFRIYGWRSYADPVNDPDWVNLGVPRVIMSIVSDASDISELYVFSVLDGTGHTIAAFGGALAGAVLAYYTSGLLYGSSPTDAFNVDVGPTVNTPASLANNELRAEISVRCSPDAELVTITIVNVPITEAVAP
jgi:phage tail sheath protein FI